MDKINNVKVNPRDLKDIKCDECGNMTFVPAMILKKVPALLSPSGKEEIIGLPVYVCNACGGVNKEFARNIPFERPDVPIDSAPAGSSVETKTGMEPPAFPVVG